MKTRHIIIGDFLGSGKTTLLLDESPLSGTEARLLLNARVQMPASALEAVARRAIAGLSVKEMKASITAFRCLTPGRPRPTYRYYSL